MVKICLNCIKYWFKPDVPISANVKLCNTDDIAVKISKINKNNNEINYKMKFKSK